MASTTPATPIFKLPPELRNEIYLEVFSELETKVTLPLIRSESKIQSPQKPHPALALLLTCKQINSEARIMAWSTIPANLFDITEDQPDWTYLTQTLKEVDANGDCNVLPSAQAIAPHAMRETEQLFKTMGNVLPHLTSLEISNRDVFDMLQSSGFFFGDVEKAVVAIRQKLIGVEKITLCKDWESLFMLARESAFEAEGVFLDNSPWVWEGGWKRFQAMFQKLKEIVIKEEAKAGFPAPRVKKFLVVDGVLVHASSGRRVYRKAT